VISGNKRQKKKPSKSGDFGTLLHKNPLYEFHYKCFVTKWQKFAGKKNADAPYLLLMMN
jgi:hypothetical protein